MVETGKIGHSKLMVIVLSRSSLAQTFTEQTTNTEFIAILFLFIDLLFYSLGRHLLYFNVVDINSAMKLKIACGPVCLHVLYWKII